ncbi:MAG: thiamine pyrophosphate-binding protein [Alphaproteobacteria bacterium]|nr:thiamine pyrophosphate-binding protein [Alphaproteobacteria bacterium]
MGALKERTGGQILVDQLKLHGVDTAFGVPGESYLAVLDALHDVNSIKFVICRQEGGAAMMADAYGKMTGRPGICMVTRGPGATNASSGVHVAFQDSTPMILFIGQVGLDAIEREAFQEIDYRRMYGQMAKWVAQIDDAARIPEYLSRAFHTATSGRPGPVVLALPEDMLTAKASVADAEPFRAAEAHPGPAAMAEIRGLLAKAKRPFVILGGSAWDEAACEAVKVFAETNRLPVGTSFRRADRFDNLHPCYAGDVGIGLAPKLAERIKAADLLLVVGARLGEMTTGGYTLFGIPAPSQAMVHVHPDPEELGRVYRPALAVNAGVKAFAAALARLDPVDASAWARGTETAHADYLAYTKPVKCPGDVQMAEIVAWLDATLPDDAIWTNGAGNFATWVHRFHRYRRLGTELAPTSGSMGYGLPAAVAAKIRHPRRDVVCFAGDGDIQMTMQELGTAAQAGAAVIVIVVNNGMYGTIRMHQEREYPERVSGTDLVNPDFAALGRAYGGRGETVTKTAEFQPAFERARASDKLAVIELKLHPEALTIRASLSEIRRQAKSKG